MWLGGLIVISILRMMIFFSLVIFCRFFLFLFIIWWIKVLFIDLFYNYIFYIYSSNLLLFYLICLIKLMFENIVVLRKC